MTFEQAPCNTDTAVINCWVPVSFKDADGVNQCCLGLTVLHCCPVVLRENFCRDEARDERGRKEKEYFKHGVNEKLEVISFSRGLFLFFLKKSCKALKLRWSAFFFFSHLLFSANAFSPSIMFPVEVVLSAWLH